MAIKRSATPVSSDNELNLTINNGDFEVLRDAMRRFGFRDEESVLRYALAVLSRSATRSLSIIDQDGVRVNLNPSADLLQQPEPAKQS
jgi:hypothetical protein